MNRALPSAMKRELDSLSAEELRRRWTALDPMEKALCFKLLDEERAMALYESLPLEERYFLLCSFPEGSIAPVARALPPAERGLFSRLSPAAYERMIKSLASDSHDR